MPFEHFDTGYHKTFSICLLYNILFDQNVQFMTTYFVLEMKKNDNDKSSGTET